MSDDKVWVARALALMPSLQDVPADAAAQRRLLGNALIARAEPASEALCAACDEVLRREGAAPAAAAAVVTIDSPPLVAGGLWLQHRSGTRLCVWRGDITTLAVDAVVNAANDAGLGCFVPSHRCIDNVLHRAAGPRLREACRVAMRARGGAPLAAGTAPLLTPGFALPAQHVLHVTGPALRRGAEPTAAQDAQLASAYRGCLDAARRAGLRSVAFCCISTGIFGFPQERAAGIALRTTRDWLDGGWRAEDGGGGGGGAEPALDAVVFDTFMAQDEALYRRLAPQVFDDDG